MFKKAAIMAAFLFLVFTALPPVFMLFHKKAVAIATAF
jgi:hypothetical protein